MTIELKKSSLEGSEIETEPEIPEEEIPEPEPDIKPEEPKEEFSCWKAIFRHLKESGYDVYPPGIKEGVCTSRYIVVRNAGRSKVPGISSDRAYYDVMLYMPRNKYSEIEIEGRHLMECMDKLFPLVRPTRQVEIPFWDYEINGYQTSFEYVNYVKSRRR